MSTCNFKKPRRVVPVNRRVYDALKLPFGVMLELGHLYVRCLWPCFKLCTALGLVFFGFMWLGADAGAPLWDIATMTALSSVACAIALAGLCWVVNLLTGRR